MITHKYSLFIIIATALILTSCGFATGKDPVISNPVKPDTVLKTQSGSEVEKKSFKIKEGVLNTNLIKFFEENKITEVTVNDNLYTVNDNNYDNLLGFINYPGRVASTVVNKSGALLIFNKDYIIVDMNSGKNQNMMMNYITMNQIISSVDNNYSGLSRLMLNNGILVPTNDLWNQFIIDNRLEEVSQSIKTNPDSKKQYYEYVQRKVKEIQDSMIEDKSGIVGKNVFDMINK